ncbi:MAG: hypothetical protein ABI390_10735 [Daejeonella sp.]
MKTILTPHLLGFLIERGYTYCLAKTQLISKSNASISITLTPVKVKPQLQELPMGYDTFYRITREPMQMAVGIDDTEVYISLNHKPSDEFRDISRAKQEVDKRTYAFE